MVPVKVPVQIGILLLLAQVVLGAVGYVLPQGLPWLGLPLVVLLLWLIVRTARILRTEMETAVKRKAPVPTPWLHALIAALVWLWPAGLLLPGWSFVPQWAPAIWNGSFQPVVDTLGLTSLTPWLWVAVPLEGLLLLAVAGRPLPRLVAPVAVRSNLAPVAGGWAPARTYKDALRKKGKQ